MEKEKWKIKKNDNEKRNNVAEFIFGRNSVNELLMADRAVNKLLVADGQRQASLNQIVQLARERKIPVQFVPEQRINLLCGNGASHQGVMAYVPPVEYVEWETIAERIHDKTRLPIIVMLDGVTDPQNLGAIIRSAEAAGALGVITTARRACPLSAAVAKAAAGALEKLPVARVNNLTQTIKQLQKMGFWAVGTAIGAEKAYFEIDYIQPLIIVMGSEDKGISRLVGENCDFLVSIPMLGLAQSLNVSVAAGLLLFEGVKQHRLIKQA